ncbi:MAG: hypothetical protein HYW86_04275 [Candidatus Roizmanbacteria bacterium]|nr:MAG: hypothetical protein HYW86_04275 [Candidatus Roizmanbacteria bacterium]
MRKKKRKQKSRVNSDKRLTQYNLSTNNRITYVYEHLPNKNTTEIICVSLDIKIIDDWVTIIYYDSHHSGILHRHTRIAYNDDADIVDYDRVKRKGTWNKLLHWAIEDIKNNYLWYKRKFLRLNKPLLKDIEVEEY